MKIQRLLHVLLGVVVMLLGCSAFSSVTLPDYDHITYDKLTNSKQMVMQLYDTFTSDTLNDSAVARNNKILDELYTYELNKGKGNLCMINQVDKIKTMFARFVKDRQDNGVWNVKRLKNAKASIASAFNIAIATEYAKNNK